MSGAVAGASSNTVLDVLTELAWLLMLASAVSAAAVDSAPAEEPGADGAPALPLAGVITSHRRPWASR